MIAEDANDFRICFSSAISRRMRGGGGGAPRGLCQPAIARGSLAGGTITSAPHDLHWARRPARSSFTENQRWHDEQRNSIIAKWSSPATNSPKLRSRRSARAPRSSYTPGAFRDASAGDAFDDSWSRESQPAAPASRKRE